MSTDAAALRTRPTRRTRGARPGLRAYQVLTLLLALVAVAPLLWLALNAFKPAEEIFTRLVPSRLTWDNLSFVFTQVPFLRYMANSAFVSVVVTVLALWFHSMTAYALARLDFRGRGVVFGAIISTMLVSLPVILVPLFLIARQLGLLDSYAGLIVPSIFNAFGIFLLRQAYLGIPRELEEAATLDGCGYLRIYRHVILPLSKPVLASLAVLFFLANWNAFLWPLTIVQDPDLRVVQMGISAMQGQYSSAWNYIMAGSLVAALPTVVLFLVGQRWLVSALKTSGMK